MNNIGRLYAFAIGCVIMVILTIYQLHIQNSDDTKILSGKEYVGGIINNFAGKVGFNLHYSGTSLVQTPNVTVKTPNVTLAKKVQAVIPGPPTTPPKESNLGKRVEALIPGSPTTPPKESNAASENENWISSITVDGECPASTKPTNTKTSSCRVPEIDPFHPSIMKFIRKTAYPHCPGTTYGTLLNGVLTFTDQSVKSATYAPIQRNGDFRYSLGTSIQVGSNKITSPFIEVTYTLNNGRTVKDYLYQVLRTPDLDGRKATKNPAIPLNILIIGIDSLSHGNTERSLPKLYSYLKDDLQGLFFKGHAIVGDGTTPQLTVMLTGKAVEEQYEARTGHSGARPLDGWSWIYKDLKERGYLTGFSEDGVWDGPFQYRLKGFSNPPTDFYPRPYFLDIAKKTKYRTDRCINNRNVAQIHLNYVQAVFDAYPDKLKFFTSFNAGFSHHEINHVTKNERDILVLLKYLQNKGYLENTLLIVMGDHGLRFGAVRTQVQGKLEERMPFYSMVFPASFRQKYPGLMKTLQQNTQRLTSWYDVYATFQHMLSYPDPPNVKRGVSLLTEVSSNRTCAQAGVPNHWCPCLDWETVDAKHIHIQKAGEAVVEYMNHVLKGDKASSTFCQPLSLKAVNFAQVERPNREVSKLHGGGLKQGSQYFCRYQLQLVTSPSEGIFEATVKYHQKRFIVSTGISRINQYGDQPKCVADKLPHVRKYCLCKDYKGQL